MFAEDVEAGVTPNQVLRGTCPEFLFVAFPPNMEVASEKTAFSFGSSMLLPCAALGQTCVEQLAQSNLRRTVLVEPLAQRHLQRGICAELTSTEHSAQSKLPRATCIESVAQAQRHLRRATKVAREART